MKRWLVGLALAVPASAWAQEASQDLVVEDGSFVIEGQVQKPEVVVVINRETLDQAIDLGLDEDFLIKIVEAAEKAPF